MNKQKYTANSDYCKELGAFYDKKNPRKIQKSYMFEVFNLCFTFIYKKVFHYIIGIKLLYFYKCRQKMNQYCESTEHESLQQKARTVYHKPINKSDDC